MYPGVSLDLGPTWIHQLPVVVAFTTCLLSQSLASTPTLGLALLDHLPNNLTGGICPNDPLVSPGPGAQGMAPG
jgi:hypothetical protein